jgi:hypothetical protein
LLGRIGYPTTESAVRIIRSGNNFEATAHDFRVAEAIWGPDIPSLKGRTVKKQTTAADVTVGPSLVQTEQVLAIDIMFVEGIPSLVGVATPLDLTLAFSLTSYDTSEPSRCAAVIKKGLAEIISTLASRNFLVKVIMSDGEGGVGSVAGELKQMGIEVDISGAGGHVGEGASAHSGQATLLPHGLGDSDAHVVLRLTLQYPDVGIERRRYKPPRTVHG